MSASSLTSTHPPIAERVRILRSMAGASLQDYDRSFQQMKGGRIMSTSALAAAGSVILRAPEPERKAEGESTKLERTRTTSNLMERLGNYRTINCNCGTRLKVPPNFRGSSVKCPHCGRTHSISR
jgi:heat shock protein HtpX